MMIKKLVQWFLLRRLKRKLWRSSGRIARQVDGLEAEMLRNEAALSEALDQHAQQANNTTAMVRDLRAQIRDLQTKQEELETENEGLRSKLRVSESITIPALVEAHRLVLKRWERETELAIQGRGVLD